MYVATNRISLYACVIPEGNVYGRTLIRAVTHHFCFFVAYLLAVDHNFSSKPANCFISLLLLGLLLLLLLLTLQNIKLLILHLGYRAVSL